MLVIILTVIIVILFYKNRVCCSAIKDKVGVEEDKVLETLKKRYTNGEISKKEYREILKELKE